MAVKVNEIVRKMNERPIWEIESDKFKATYTLQPTEDGFIFYHFTVSKGKLPRDLESKWSNPQRALDYFRLWEAKQPKSQATKRDENTEAREKQKSEKVE